MRFTIPPIWALQIWSDVGPFFGPTSDHLSDQFFTDEYDGKRTQTFQISRFVYNFKFGNKKTVEI
jgi:hypothetical protein